MKNRWKKRNSFTPAPVFFGLGDPYDSTYFTIRKPLVVFLLLSVFSLKMHHNSSKNGSPKKHLKTMPLETQKHPKMPWNSMLSLPKNAKLQQKIDFWKGCVFSDFLSGDFSSFWQILVSKWAPKTSRGPHFWDHFGVQNPFFEAAAFFLDFSRKNVEKILKFNPGQLKIP